MRYEKYVREVEELKKTPLPLPLGEEWVKIRVRTAKQCKMCLERGIPVSQENVILSNGIKSCHQIAYFYVKFDDIINLFD